MGDHYYTKTQLKEFGDDGEHINILFKKSELKPNVDPTTYFQSQNMLSKDVDKHLYGEKVDEILKSLRQQIKILQSGGRFQFNLASVQELGYILFNVCPRDYKKVGKMDYLADQVDTFENVFKRAIIAICTPENTARTFVLGDNPIVMIDKNGKSAIERIVNIPIEGKKGGIYLITKDADFVFCMIVHPKIRFDFHYKWEYINRPIEKVPKGTQRPIVCYPLPDSKILGYNRIAMQQSRAYVTGKLDELKILQNSLNTTHLPS